MVWRLPGLVRFNSPTAKSNTHDPHAVGASSSHAPANLQRSDQKPHAELNSLKRIFSGDRIFQASDSEHIFRWAAPEAAQFIMELEENADHKPDPTQNDECAYLGVLSAAPKSDSEALSIIDGMQRLVLTTMFLAFARDRASNNRLRNRLDKMLFKTSWGGTRKARIRLPEKEQDWFYLFILDKGATLDLPNRAQGDCEQKLLRTAKFMRMAFNAYSPKRLTQLVRTLTHRTAMVLSIGPVDTTRPRTAIPSPAQIPERPKSNVIPISIAATPTPIHQPTPTPTAQPQAPVCQPAAMQVTTPPNNDPADNDPADFEFFEDLPSAKLSRMSAS